ATVVTSADLQATKTAPATAVPGTNGSYSVTVKNNGPSDAQGAQMNDPLPAGTTFVSVVAPGGWACTTPAVGTNGTVNCTTPTLALNASAVFTINIHFKASIPSGTNVTNTATA